MHEAGCARGPPRRSVRVPLRHSRPIEWTGTARPAITAREIWRSGAMEPTSMTGEAASTPQSGRPTMASDLPIGRKELGELARWVPAKEMALLIEICERASRDPDLLR